jgi:hypothetical protein
VLADPSNVILANVSAASGENENAATGNLLGGKITPGCTRFKSISLDAAPR